MKKLIILLQIINAITFSMCFSYANSNLDKQFLCLRSIIENKIGGRIGIDFVTKTVSAYMLADKNPNSALQLLSDCEGFHNNNEKDKELSDLNYETYLSTFKDKVDPSVYSFVDGLVHQKLNCSIYEIGIKFAAFIGLENSHGINYCISTAGRRYLTSSNTSSLTVALALGTHVSFKNYLVQMDDRFLSGFHKSNISYGEVLIGGFKENGEIIGVSIGPIINIPQENNQDFYMTENGFNMRTLPLGDSSKFFNQALNKTIN